MIPILNNSIGALPGLDLQTSIEVIAQFLFSSLRIGAFLLASPLFGAKFVLLPVRIAIAMVITLMVFAINPVMPNIQTIASINGIVIAATEIGIGLTAGLVLTIIFSAVGLAGEKIAASSGLSMAQQVDPTSGTSSPVVSQILTLFMLVVFLSFDGHLVAVRTLIESYRHLPIGSFPNPETLIQSGILASETMFFAAAVIMLPIVIILLLINVAIGVVTRSAPTLNLFSFGFPITMLGVFFMLYISAGPIALALSNLADEAIYFMQDTLGALTDG